MIIKKGLNYTIEKENDIYMLFSEGKLLAETVEIDGNQFVNIYYKNLNSVRNSRNYLNIFIGDCTNYLTLSRLKKSEYFAKC